MGKKYPLKIVALAAVKKKCKWRTTTTKWRILTNKDTKTKWRSKIKWRNNNKMKIKNEQQHHKNLTIGSLKQSTIARSFWFLKNDYRSVISIAFICNIVIQNQNQIFVLPFIQCQILTASESGSNSESDLESDSSSVFMNLDICILFSPCICTLLNKPVDGFF